MTGGKALNPDMKEKQKSQTGLELHEGCGQSETVSDVGAGVSRGMADPQSFCLPGWQLCSPAYRLGKLITQLHQLFFPFGIKVI